MTDYATIPFLLYIQHKHKQSMTLSHLGGIAIADGKKPPTLPSTAELPNVVTPQQVLLVLGAVVEHTT